MTALPALCPSRPDRPFHGLWSLWDMLELDAGSFYHVTTRLASLRAFLDAKRHESSIGIIESVRASLQSDVADLLDHLDILNARVSRVAANELAQELRFENVTWGEFGEAVRTLDATLNRELSLIPLFVIESEKQKYFKPTAPIFGANFEEKYISAGFELDEAAKCLALGRPTASVFHLMRMMEIGVRAVARCLGIADPLQPAERNWGFVLRKVREGIDANWPTVATRSSGDGELFDALYASLDAVKNPWRNPTMHPANKYTDDEAEHVFMAVRGFMMKLAARCDENGEPKA